MGRPGVERPERGFGAGADDDDASGRVEVGAALDRRDGARTRRGTRGEIAVAKPAEASSALTTTVSPRALVTARSSPSPRGSALETRRAARGGRARTRSRRRRHGLRAHEREVGARQLEQKVGLGRSRARGCGTESVEEVGRRPQVAGAGSAADRDVELPRRARISATSEVVVVLPAVPVIPMRRPLPALEQQVAEARDARALGAQALRRAGRSGVQTSR